jgi:hypothetical protein
VQETHGRGSHLPLHGGSDLKKDKGFQKRRSMSNSRKPGHQLRKTLTRLNALTNVNGKLCKSALSCMRSQKRLGSMAAEFFPLKHLCKLFIFLPGRCIWIPPPPAWSLPWCQIFGWCFVHVYQYSENDLAEKKLAEWRGKEEVRGCCFLCLCLLCPLVSEILSGREILL